MAPIQIIMILTMLTIFSSYYVYLLRAMQTERSRF